MQILRGGHPAVDTLKTNGKLRAGTKDKRHILLAASCFRMWCWWICQGRGRGYQWWNSSYPCFLRN
ncbi:Os03g0597800 [Oryza sativa Japonica Group]|uniref:Os03g0597800 protein n=3 Tax=Oryza sativa TaxID=4530 RepID=B9F9K6_ORYSJ|nr:hypothetical protein OsI_12501 [Oryza sativa Indica Group]EEE59454.1 hypothetical protein OsJ_11642 [Oryza sativa Japonica Group]KAB8092559.1 hypothetical protein EE612_018758 [Oryza sativa]BAS85173.1 Os03g0597800 [Oryza sativa Japonica Group]